jgi:hypothetical protein
VAAPILVGPDIPGGTRLLAELDREHLPVIAAFWRYPTTESDWQFVLASPIVDAEGSMPVYERIQGVLQRLPDIRIPLRKVVAIGEHDPVLRYLRQSLPVTVPPEGFQGTLTLPNYFSSSPYVVGDDATVQVYLYRFTPNGSTAAATKS